MTVPAEQPASRCTGTDIMVTSTASVHTVERLGSPWVVSEKNGFRVTFDESNVRLYAKGRRQELEAQNLDTTGLDRLEAQLFDGSGRPIDIAKLGPGEQDWQGPGAAAAALHAVEVAGLMAHGFLGPVSVYRLRDGVHIAEYEIQTYVASNPAGDIRGVRYIAAEEGLIDDSCIVVPG